MGGVNVGQVVTIALGVILAGIVLAIVGKVL